MKYLLDNHALTNRLLEGSIKRNDICVTQQVAEEYAFDESEIRKIRRAGIEILIPKRIHLLKMQEVLRTHGKNLRLIRLYTSKGAGDIEMLAYALAERDTPEGLFPENYTLITRDNELIKVATEYGLACAMAIPGAD